MTGGLIAGATAMSRGRFLGFNALGAGSWVGVWATLGYLAGVHITAIHQRIQHYERYVAVGLAVLVSAGVARHLLARRGRDSKTR